jgi:hypothetical protein
MDELQYVEHKGICYMTNGEESELTSEIPQAARLWVIANYLLVKNNCTYMYISGFIGEAQDYGSLILFPEYSIAIGHPTGEMTKTQGIFQRVYSGGLALVNPYAKKVTVKLPPGSYVDVNGNPVVSPVIMEKQTGLVLLKAE